jgi:predicted Holliday junction resolvase-like endonuclease
MLKIELHQSIFSTFSRIRQIFILIILFLIILILNFYIKQLKLEIQRKSFSHVGVKWWNEVPSCIRELPKRAFKKRIRYFLLDILQNENTYPDIESLSCKIKKRSRTQ